MWYFLLVINKILSRYNFFVKLMNFDFCHAPWQTSGFITHPSDVNILFLTMVMTFCGEKTIRNRYLVIYIQIIQIIIINISYATFCGRLWPLEKRLGWAQLLCYLLWKRQRAELGDITLTNTRIVLFSHPLHLLYWRTEANYCWK